MTQKPNEQILESLSALTDGEASELELHRILKNIAHDQALRDTWRRYQVIGAVMRREAVVTGNIDVSAEVAAALDGESTHDMAPAQPASDDSKTPSTANWRHWLGKTSIAAGVAAVMVMGVNQWQAPASSTPSPQMAANNAQQSNDAQAAVSAPLGFDLPLPEARTVSNQAERSQFTAYTANDSTTMRVDDLTDAATQDLLNQLLIEHSQRASVNGSLGIMPFARVSKMDETSAD